MAEKDVMCHPWINLNSLGAHLLFLFFINHCILEFTPHVV